MIPAGTKFIAINDDTSLSRIWTVEEILDGYVPYIGATSDVDLGKYGIIQTFSSFNTSPTTIPTTQGSMYWNVDRQSVSLIMNGTTGELMQDSYYYVKNQSGSTITKGTVVMAAGTLGASGRILIVPFLADGTYPSTYCMGVTSEDIVDGADGMVLNFGQIRNIDTSSYSDGDLLYASSTTPGAFTTTVPTAPENIVLLAIVIHAASNGVIHVRPTFGSNINDDEGVKIVSPANGDVLMYNSTTGLWYNGVVSGGGGSTTWGSITGTLSNQTDLQSALNAKYDASNPAGYIDSSALSPYLTSATAASTYYPLTNPSGYISGIVSSDVITALGYTPVPDTRTLTINGTSYDLTADRSWTISGSAPSGTMVLLYADETDLGLTNSLVGAKNYALASNTYSRIMVESEISFQCQTNTDNWVDFEVQIGATIYRTIPLKQDATGNGDDWKLAGSLKYSGVFTSATNIYINTNVQSGSGTWYIHSLRVYGIV